MSGDIPRLALQTALKPLLPGGWRIVPAQQSVDSLSAPVVKLRMLQLIRPEGVGRGAIGCEFTASIYAPASSKQSEDDAIDDGVLELLGAIERAGISWSQATKTTNRAGTNLAWEITLTITATLTE